MSRITMMFNSENPWHLEVIQETSGERINSQTKHLWQTMEPLLPSLAKGVVTATGI